MNKKKFIQAQGATCRNWTWSWSYINEKEKKIIFGAWDKFTKGNTSLIFSEDWQTYSGGRKAPGYNQSREHIRLIEEGKYVLKTFPIKYSTANQDIDGKGPAKIEDFDPQLTGKSLKRVGGNWYASNDALDNLLSEEIEGPELFTEGASITVSVNTYERSADARAKCVQYHGYKCSICGFDFDMCYGAIGKNYIHVHHIVPLSEINNGSSGAKNR